MGPPVIADNKFVSIHSGASPFSTPGSDAIGPTLRFGPIRSLRSERKGSM